MNSFEYSSTETEQLEVKQGDTQTVSQEPGPVSISVSMPETAPSAETKKEEEVRTDHPKPDGTFEMETIPQITNELTFACLLIPRFSDHYLSGDITRDLEVWLKEVCISYGWRLSAITIRPGYLQWGMSVPLTANPAHFMKIVRQQTSLKIFEDYPRFTQKNLSHDFWAPGFSIVHGERPQSSDDINNFILQTRRQQGIY